MKVLFLLLKFPITLLNVLDKNNEQFFFVVTKFYEHETTAILFNPSFIIFWLQ
jgi:hypothetical protein